MRELDEHIFDINKDLLLFWLSFYLEWRKCTYINTNIPTMAVPIFSLTRYKKFGSLSYSLSLSLGFYYFFYFFYYFFSYLTYFFSSFLSYDTCEA